MTATDDCDGSLIMGGEDIAPPRFSSGGTGYEGETHHFEVADAGQVALARRALDRRTPLLGICRGLQIINVALGGTLVQSAHHQSVGLLGTGLLPAGVAPDSLVEAVEHESAPITGVQWHPEAPDSPAEQLPLLLAALQARLAEARVAEQLAEQLAA